jgi:lysyl-tRNA synthetase class 1
VDVRERAAAEKGAPLEPREEEILAERIRAARGWLESYAPDKARIVIHRDAVPDAARALDDSQRAYLAALADRLERADWVGEAVQAEIFSVAQELGLKPGVAFSALYAAFLGERSGPRAGWLLAALDREFVVARLREAAAADTLPA